MKLKASPITITADNPFEQDALDRKRCAEVLTNLIKNSSQPTVLAMNSPWGTGKTTFLGMWSSQLRSAGFPVIQFNAWENDYSADALTSLMGEIQAGLKALKIAKADKDKALIALEKTKEFVGGLLLASVPTALRIASGGILNLEKEAVDAISGGVEKIADKKIEEYIKGKDAIKGLRKSLEEMVSVLPAVEGAEDAIKMVVIVDELDRCRPTFAIDVLEKIKHFFGIKGIMFVVAVDREQLSHSVKTVYGAEMDTDGYLRGFFDFEFRFPKVAIRGYHDALVRRLGIDENINLRKDSTSHNFIEVFHDAFAPLAEGYSLSLRAQEQAFVLFALALRTTPRATHLYPLLLAVLVFLKIKLPKLYSGFASGNINPTDIVAEFSKASLPIKPSRLDHWLATVEVHLVYAYPNREWADAYLTRIQQTAQLNAAVRQASGQVKEGAHADLIMRQRGNIPYDLEDAAKYLCDKLEFVSSILTDEQIKSTGR